jgi:hypothetical protein
MAIQRDLDRVIERNASSRRPRSPKASSVVGSDSA